MSVEIVRAVDANLNRAREALRVLEDSVRFGYDRASWSVLLKNMRHGLEEVPESLGVAYRDLLESRGASRDVGVGLTVDRGEMGDRGIRAANWKRLQEALRSLEESARALGRTEAAARLERHRFSAYQAEQEVEGGIDRAERLKGIRLYLVAGQADCLSGWERTIRAALKGGIGMIQLREKDGCDRLRLDRACQLRRWTREAGVPLIINDRPDVARLAQTDGVHLGQEDLPVAQARQILGPFGIVGVSTHSLEQAIRAEEEGADYIGIGPVFATPTKEGRLPIGLGVLQEVCRRVSIPVFAIGGIDASNIREVVSCGARRVAVVRAVAGQADPEGAARRLLASFSDSSVVSGRAL
jgi:thiamine-phosphate pyrophosphorylase